MSNKHLKRGLTPSGVPTGERISWECQRAFYSCLRSPVLAVIPLQIAGMLFVSPKGAGQIYLDLLPLLVLITVASVFFVCLVQGNQKILLLTMILLTVGTMLQSLFKAEYIAKNPEKSSGRSLTLGLQLQYIAALLLAVLTGFLYWNLRECSSLKMAEFLTIVSLFLSVFTLIFAKSVGNVRNWIVIGGFSFQTTELIKLLYLFISAALLGTVERPRKERLVWFYLISFIMMGFLVVQSEFGTLLLLLMVFMTYLFLFVPDLKIFGITAISMGVFSGFLTFLGIRMERWAAAGSSLGTNPLARKYIANFQKIANRVIYWMHPEKDPLGQGYQLIKARESIVLGGWFGTSSVTDLPVKTSDLVFPALIQRCGMIFALLVFLVFILLWLEGMKVCLRKKDKYHRMMAVGLVSMFFNQSIIIIAGSTGLCPLTGITLPFISSGGSSLVVSFMLMSLLLCISGNISWKGQSSEEIEFFEKSTNCAKRVFAFGHRHVRGLVPDIRSGARSLTGSGSAKSRSKAGGV